MSKLDFFAQSSNLAIGVSRRAGIEPLLRLNTSWNAGLITVAASLAWACTAAGFFCWNIARLSMLKVNAF
ncbi:hypothetical protein D3C72_1913570 [compost metagenome]